MALTSRGKDVLNSNSLLLQLRSCKGRLVVCGVAAWKSLAVGLPFDGGGTGTAIVKGLTLGRRLRLEDDVVEHNREEV